MLLWPLVIIALVWKSTSATFGVYEKAPMASFILFWTANEMTEWILVKTTAFFPPHSTIESAEAALRLSLCRVSADASLCSWAKEVVDFSVVSFLMERKSQQHIYPRFSSENQSRIPSHKLFQELLCFRAFYEKSFTCNDPLPNLSCLCTKTLWSLDGYNGANRRRGKFFVQKFLSSRGK